MNDCFWSFLGLCSESCKNCTKYLSVNSEDGEKMLEEYHRQIDYVLTPLLDEWRKIMNEYSAN